MKMCHGHHNFGGGRRDGNHHCRRHGFGKRREDHDRRGCGRHEFGHHGHHELGYHRHHHCWGPPRDRPSPPKDGPLPVRDGTSPPWEGRCRCHNGPPARHESERNHRFKGHRGPSHEFWGCAERRNACKCCGPYPEQLCHQGRSPDRQEPDTRPARPRSAPPEGANEGRLEESTVQWGRRRGMGDHRGHHWKHFCG